MTNPIPIRLPLVINGQISLNPIEILNSDEKKSEYQSLIKKYCESGCKIICAPTQTANRNMLSKLDENFTVSYINEELIALTKSSCDNQLVAGAIGPIGDFIEPFGEMSFSEAMDIFSEQATALKSAGADVFWINGIVYIGEIRAALIACNKLKLPVFVTVSTDKFGITATDSTALSYLIPLQEMGVAAFGISSDCMVDDFSAILKELFSFSKIPLIALHPVCACDDDKKFSLTPKEYQENCDMLLKSGSEILSGSNNFTPEYALSADKSIENIGNYEVKIDKEDTSLILSNAKQVFYLSPDGTEISEPVECTVDMADVLLELSNTNLDVIRVDVVTTDDAYQFSQNAYMSKLPIIFHSDDKNALKLALLSYHGRAMIDSKCGIELEELKKIANKYGAVIY